MVYVEWECFLKKRRIWRNHCWSTTCSTTRSTTCSGWTKTTGSATCASSIITLSSYTILIGCCLTFPSEYSLSKQMSGLNPVCRAIGIRSKPRKVNFLRMFIMRAKSMSVCLKGSSWFGPYTSLARMSYTLSSSHRSNCWSSVTIWTTWNDQALSRLAYSAVYLISSIFVWYCMIDSISSTRLMAS